MSDDAARLSLWDSFLAWRNGLVASTKFQTWAARFPLTRGIARRDGAKLFDLVSGFVYSQVLMACVELDLFRLLKAGPLDVETLARRCDIPAQRMKVLLQAAASLDLLSPQGERYGLGRLGAATLGVPGLEAMIRHHTVFYRDLEDPVSLLRGQETELSQFWPYVFGGDVPPETAAKYSELMASSQGLVATETLDSVSLKGIRHLMDVGGGTGAFLAEVARREPDIALTLFDLPQVVANAEQRLGAGSRVQIVPGSFREDELPEGADAISLIRVLYDHADETVEALLKKVHDRLPPGGRIIVSEPMSGGTRPDRAGDAYFALYTMAMQTGRVRSQSEVAALLQRAGFNEIRQWPVRRAYVTATVTAKRN